jgi:hypothetical protein
MGNMVRERKQQIKIALTDDTREALELLASQTGGSLAAEVRNFVVYGLYCWRAFDQKTNQLSSDLAVLASDVAAVSNGVTWHEHPAVHAALAEAIAVWLEFIKPSTSEKTVPPDYEPCAVGATVARMRMRAEAETAQMRSQVNEADKFLAIKQKELEERMRQFRTKQKPRKKSK